MWALRFLFLTAALFMVRNVAYGYEMTHDYYSRYRPQYGNNVYLSEEVLAAQTQGTAVRADAGDNSSGTVAKYQGYVLHTAAGIENFHFIQTGVFYSNTQESDVRSSANTLSGHEAGAEAKAVLQSPIANFVIGGGIFYASKTLTQNYDRTSLSGVGYKGSLDVQYYASSNVCLLFSAMEVVESLKDKSGTQTVQSLSVTSTRAGAGINIWL